MTVALFKCFILMLVPSCIHTYTIPDRANNQPGTQRNENLVPPRIKMHLRILRNFVYGSEAKITLIYQSSRKTKLRWFKKDDTKYLGGSEVPGFFPMDGDPRFWTEFLVSDDTTSATLHIRRYQNMENTPDEYEAIITSLDGSVQYNIRTYIVPPVQYDHHYIYSPEWLIPLKATRFEVGGDLTVGCQAVVPLEMVSVEDGSIRRYPPYQNLFNSGNELFFNRFLGNLQIQPPERVIAIHVGADPHKRLYLKEQSKNSPLIISSYREPLKLKHVIYNVNMTTTNATRDLEGIYQCSFERQDMRMVVFEKSFINSEVILTTTRSPYISSNSPPGMKVRVKPCNGEEYRDRITLDVDKGDDMCVRCVSMGYPQPKITLMYKAIGSTEAVVMKHTHITAIEYINVADGGLVETMYVFRNTECSLAGKYTCKAENKKGSRSAPFELTVNGC